MEALAIYGTGIYGRAIYGDKYQLNGTAPNTLCGIPLGLQIRRDFNKEIIFRVCRGNGYAGTKAGKQYQHRYKYFVPSTIMHPNGDASRAKFAAAVSTWHSLTDEQKTSWNRQASRAQKHSGFTYYISNYMKG